MLRSRISLLSGEDRLLLTMYLERGSSFRQLARLTGVADAVVARRIYKVIGRLADGQYIICLRNRDRLGGCELAVAKDRLLMGLPIEEIAQRRELTVYRVRKTLEHIREIVGNI